MPRAAEPNSCVPAQDCTQQEVNYGAQVPGWQELPPGARCSPQTLWGACRQRYQLPFHAVADKPGESGSFAWGRRAAEPGLKPISSLSSSRLSTHYCVPGLDWALSTEW